MLTRLVRLRPPGTDDVSRACRFDRSVAAVRALVELVVQGRFLGWLLHAEVGEKANEPVLDLGDGED